MIIILYYRRQVGYDASVDIYLTAKTIHDHRPGVWTSPANILALYRAVEVFLARQNNKNSGELSEHLSMLSVCCSFEPFFRRQTNTRGQRGQERHCRDSKVKTVLEF